MTRSRFCAGGIASRSLPELEPEIAALREYVTAPDCTAVALEDDRADARHRHQPPAAGILAGQRLDRRRDLIDAIIEAAPIDAVAPHDPHHRGLGRTSVRGKMSGRARRNPGRLAPPRCRDRAGRHDRQILPTRHFPGSRIEQAYLILAEGEFGVRRAIAEANGVSMTNQPLLPGWLYLVLTDNGGQPKESIIIQTYVARSEPSGE